MYMYVYTEHYNVSNYLPVRNQSYSYSASEGMYTMFSFPNIVFKHPVALTYHLIHIYFRLKCNVLYIVTLLPHYMVRLYTAIIRRLLSC
jgi:hypothetical protein